MKVLVVHNRYREYGGEDRYVEFLEAALAGAGEDVVPLAARSAGVPPGIRGRIGAAGSLFYSRAAARRARAIARGRGRPDVAHAHNLYPLLSPSVLLALRAEDIPVVMSLHNWRLFCTNGLFRLGGEHCERCAGRSTLRALPHRCRGPAGESVLYSLAIELHRRMGWIDKSVDRFLVPHEAMLSRLVALGIGASRVTVVPHGVPARFFAPPPPPGETALFVGRLSEEKGVNVLLRAWERLGGIPLEIAGAGPLEGEVRRAAERHTDGGIRPLGFLEGDALLHAYGRARLVVVPSLADEVQSLSVLESFACSRPVVATRVGAHPEVVGDGEDGILVEPGDAGGLAQAVRALYDDPVRAAGLGRVARRKAEERYTPVAFAARVRAAYRAVIAERATPGLPDPDLGRMSHR